MSSEKKFGLDPHDITVVRAFALDSPDNVSATSQDKDKVYPSKVHTDIVNSVNYPSDSEDQNGRDPNRKKKWYAVFLEPGGAPQIIVAALLAIAIGMTVNATVDEVPTAAIEIVGIPGRLWLRALTAVVLPLIVTCMVIAVQRLKEMSQRGGSLAKWCICWYIGTTFVALVPTILLASLLWAKLYPVASEENLVVASADQATIAEREKLAIWQVVVNLGDSFVTNNIVNSLAQNALLAVMIVSTIIGYLIKGPETIIYKGIIEADAIITQVVTFLIKLAPVGVFFLILSNIMRLDMAAVGTALGIHIGACLTCFFLHLLVVLPLLFFIFTRFQNPYAYWIKCTPALATAWGTASSAATLPVTMRTLLKRKVPKTIVQFAVPLGCMINMDGSSIHFPIAVTFLARTQGITLSAADYVIITFLSTLGAIAGAPLPSAGLVLIVMIAGSVNVPITGMYAVIVAIDWFLDRFRTVINITGDLYAARIFEVQTGIKDGDDDDHVMPDPLEVFNARREEA